MNKKLLILMIILVALYMVMFYDYVKGQDIINDPLTNSSTVGSRNGGTFSADGWKTTDEWSYIQYNTLTITSGMVEFDVKGIYSSNVVFPNCNIDKHGVRDCSNQNVHYQLFNIWDRDDTGLWWAVKQWHNPYKAIVHVYGYVEGDVYKWKYAKLRLNVSAYEGGYDNDPHAFEDPSFGPIQWTKDHTYHFKLIWGNGHFKLYIDGSLMKDWDYSTFGVEYAPPSMSMRLGSAINSVISGGFKAPVGITYSNFRLSASEDKEKPRVELIEYTTEKGEVTTTSDVLIQFSKPMNSSTVQSNVHFYPAFDYRFDMVGNVAVFRNKGVLQDNTIYTVNIDTSIKAQNGQSLIMNYVYSFKTNKSFPDTLYLYEYHDFPVYVAGLAYPATFIGTFTNGTRTITLDGFADGYSWGRVRFAPDKLGVWNYNINGITGTTICVESNSKGFIRTNGTKFNYDNGEEWKWLGNTVWRGYTSLMSYSTRWKEIVDLSASQNYTCIQSITHSFINGNTFWSNEGGKCFEGINDSEANYDRLNPEYFRWMDKRFDYALKKGIVPVIFFTWGQDYVKFSSLQFNRYVKYLVSRYSAMNVVWIICGEFNEITDFEGRLTSEFNQWGSLVKQKDPYNHLTSLHPTGRSSSREFGSSVWMNFVGQQTPYPVDITRDLEFGKPVVNEEPRYMYPEDYGAGSNIQTYEMLVDIVKRGGYYTNGFYTYYAPDKGGFDLSALPDEQKFVAALNRMVRENRIPDTVNDVFAEISQNDNVDIDKPNKVTGVVIVK